MRCKQIYSFMRAMWFAGMLISIIFFASSLQAQTSNAPVLLSMMADDSADSASQEAASTEPEKKPLFNIYGFVMLDMIYDFKTNNPDWFDVVRPTKLPAFEGEFGEDGHFYGSVRQTRFGMKANFPTHLGEVKTIFEFELFGTGVDQGQTTFRLRHAYGELGHFGGGQTWSPFMDIDVFPNSIEYWGPSGMVFFRNVLFQWMPIQGESRLTIALERPGASADQGAFADRNELQNIRGRFPAPNVSAEYRYGADWGYVEVAGLYAKFKWDDLLQDEFDLSGSANGWGINLSSNIKFGQNTLRLQYVFGEGIENYMNDAPTDIGIQTQFQNPITPIIGVALPVQGVVAFMDITWNEKWTSTVGYSLIDIDNSDGQLADAFHEGQYALGNLLYYPTKNVMMGGELQWGWRENFLDGFTSDDYRIQFSFKYKWDLTYGGN